VLPWGCVNVREDSGEAVPRPEIAATAATSIGDTVARQVPPCLELPVGWRNSSVAIPCHR